MTTPLAPYGIGREWMAGKGPHGDKDYFEAMEGFGFDFTGPDEQQFAAGADAYADEVERYGSAEV